MARRSRRQTADSLDSLLDTMANVVGILVVLVAVSQLTLGEAVERIREQAGERAAATPDDLAQIIGEREDIEAETSRLRSLIESFVARKTAGMMMADVRPLLDDLESLPGRTSAVGDVPSESAIRNDRLVIERLAGEVRSQKGERERLLAILAEPEVTTQPRVIRLPDPRPVPEGMERVFFFCRGDAVQVINLPALEDVLRDGIQDATGISDRNIMLELRDFPWIVNHFAKENVSDQGFRWVFDSADPTRFLAELIPTEGVAAGDRESDLLAGGSRTERALDALNPRRQYVRFFVWPDSFDVYLTVRQIAEKRGLRVGWQEVQADENLRFDIMRSARPGRRLLD